MKEVMLALHQKPVAYYPIYKDVTGSTTAGILLSQLMYWWQKVGGREFYKTDAEIIEETHLSAQELKTAKKALKLCDFIKIKARGVPAKTFYDIDTELLIQTIQKGDFNHHRKVKSTKLKRAIQPNSDGEINNTITENTQETTTESTLSIPRTNFLKTLPKNQPDEQSNSGGLVYNLEAGKIAAQFFCKTYLELNPDWKNSQYALPYFQNLQKKGEWFVLQIPEKTMTRQRWIGQHLSGIDQWASRESRFFKTGTNRYPNVTSPMPVYVMPKPNYSIED